MPITKPETPRPHRQSRRRISWDVIRVVAIFAVVLQHITHQAPINHPELGRYPVELTLQFGASTLIVISAFFVCVTVRRGDTGRWLWSKLARLLPAYLLAVVVTYTVSRAVNAAFGWYLPDLTDLIGNLLMIQGWSPEFHWIDASYWTLPVQVMAFVAAALLWPRGWRRGPHLRVLLWATIVVPLVIRFAWRQDDAAQWIKSMFDGLGLHRVALFGVGIAIWLWSTKRMSGWHLAGYLAAELIAQDAHSYFVDTSSTIAFGVILLGIVAAAGGPDWAIPGIRQLAPVITWLGGISYGVYLVHQELGFVLARLMWGAGIGPWPRITACVVMAIVLGWLLTRLVERPVHRWLTTTAPDLAARLTSTATSTAHAARTLGGRLAQPQAGRAGAPPVSAEPSPLPVSQARTSAVEPLTSGELALVAAARSQVR